MSYLVKQDDDGTVYARELPPYAKVHLAPGAQVFSDMEEIRQAFPGSIIKNWTERRSSRRDLLQRRKREQ